MKNIIPINERMKARHREQSYLKNGRLTSEKRAENIRNETVRLFRESVVEALKRDEYYGSEDIDKILSEVRLLRNKHQVFEKTFGLARAYEALKDVTDEFMPENFVLPITDPAVTNKDWELISMKRQAADVEARILAAGIQSERDYDIDDIKATFDGAAGIYWTRVMQERQRRQVPEGIWSEKKQNT